MMTGSEERSERGALDRERVVRVALELLDEVGLDDLSMRRLAERLGVTAASLYWYVRDKSELLDLLADAMSAELPFDRAVSGLSWRAQLEAAGRALRQLARAHRDAARILAGTTPSGPNRLRAIDRLLGILRGAGFSPEDTADAAYVFNSYVIGYLLDEALGPERGFNQGRTDAADAPPRGNLTHARLVIERGGVDLTLNADPTLATLYQMTAEGRAPEVTMEGDIVRVFRRYGPRGALHLTLAGAVRWEIVIRGGVSRLSANLSGSRLASLEIMGGLDHAVIQLAQPEGVVPIRMSADTNRLRVERPPTAAIRARLNHGGSRVTLDGAHLGSVGNGTELESPNYSAARDRYDVVIGGASAHLTLAAAAPSPVTPAPNSRAMRPLIDNWLSADLSPDDYPNLFALAPQMAHPDTDRRFEVGMQILLDGLEGRLKGLSTPPKQTRMAE
jgi:TetR/AcrR family tetracycline transcriptional repressor